MKQNALEPAPGDERAGAWLKLSSATFQTDKGASSPEVRVSATLAEVTPSAPQDAKVFGTHDASEDAPETGAASPRSSLSRDEANHASAPRDAAATPSTEAREKSKTQNAPHPEPAPAKETTHLFTLTADVRSFKSTRRLPFPTASVVVKLSLPAELLDAVSLGGKPRAAAATPVRTNPPAAVARASRR